MTGYGGCRVRQRKPDTMRRVLHNTCYMFGYVGGTHVRQQRAQSITTRIGNDVNKNNNNTNLIRASVRRRLPFFTRCVGVAPERRNATAAHAITL